MNQEIWGTENFSFNWYWVESAKQVLQRNLNKEFISKGLGNRASPRTVSRIWEKKNKMFWSSTRTCGFQQKNLLDVVGWGESKGAICSSRVKMWRVHAEELRCNSGPMVSGPICLSWECFLELNTEEKNVSSTTQWEIMEEGIYNERRKSSVAGQ